MTKACYDLPGSSKDGKAHGETNADVGPGVGADAVEHVFPALVRGIEARTWEGHNRHFSVHVFCLFLIGSLIGARANKQ